MLTKLRKYPRNIPYKSFGQQTAPYNPIQSKLALIIGDASGIGYASARTLLARNAEGVILSDFDEDQGATAIMHLTKEFGPSRASFIHADLTDKTHLQNLFESVMARLGRIDILINNVLKAQGERHQTDINAGVVMSTILGFDYMGVHKKRNGGIIINVNCMLGPKEFDNPKCNVQKKRFLVDFVKSMGHEYYESLTGVKILGICPKIREYNILHESDLSTEGTPGMLPAIDLCGLVAMLCDGENGSVWVADGKDCQKVLCRSASLQKQE